MCEGGKSEGEVTKVQGDESRKATSFQQRQEKTRNEPKRNEEERNEEERNEEERNEEER